MTSPLLARGARPRRPPTRAGSALVSTLLVLLILSIIVIAFLQSMTLERQTARSYRTIAEAELAANAAVEEAIGTLQRFVTNHPDSVTTWDPNLTPGSEPLPATLLFYYDTPAATITEGDLPLPRFLPLTSGATSSEFKPHGARDAALDRTAGTVNLNAPGFALKPGQPWIGRFPTGSPSLDGNDDSAIHVPWVPLALDVNGTPKTVARYAFWVEDESFRVNLNTAGSARRGSNTWGEKPAEIPVQGVGDTLSSEADSSLGDALASAVSNVKEKPNLGRVPTPLTLKQANFEAPDEATFRFLVTTASAGSNLSRTGAARTNPNSLVTNTSTPATIASEVASIAQVITDGAPGFGQRLYAKAEDTKPVPEEDASIYVNRIAANLRDYIDTDSNPTVLDEDGEAYDGGSPTEALDIPGSTNDYPVVGKEAIPRLQETLMRVKQSTGMGGVGATSSPYTIRISYYFEFWNPSTRDISVDDLGEGAFISVKKQPTWEDAGTGFPKEPPFQPKPDPLTIPFSAFQRNGQPLVFPAGEVTVLTTDPEPNTLVVGSSAGIFKTARDAQAVYIAPSYEFQQSGTLTRNNNSTYGGRPTLQIQIPGAGPTNNSVGYYDTEIILGNSKTYLDSHAQALPIRPGIYVDSFGSKSNHTYFHLRGGRIRGNVEGENSLHVGEGDPVGYMDRRQFSPSGQNTPTGFINWRSNAGQSATDTQQQSTLGKAPNQGVNPALWPDGYSSAQASKADGGAPYVIRNEPLRITAELGDLYDSRRNSTNPFAGGGGNTLRIGQPETTGSFPVWNGDPTKVARNRTAWRLLDLFAINTAPTLSGLINLNGALRDNGAALRAALSGFRFSDDDDGVPARKGSPLNESALDELVTSLTDRLKPSSPPAHAVLPLLERGEASELSFFASGTAGGAAQSTVADRSREEIFRRLAELTCTRGTIFTVYAVGQSVESRGSSPLRVLSTQRRKVTFELIPEITNGKVTTQRVRILSSSTF